MTFELSPAGLALTDEYQGLLLSYRPQCMPNELWDHARAGVLDLVAKCQPKFPREVAMLAGSLCRVLATFADQTDEPSVGELLTQRNVDALLARFALDGMNDGTRGQHQVRLRRLLRTHAGTAKAAPLPKRKARELQPYSEAEVQQLVECFDHSLGPVRQAGLDALLLGLGHGIVLPHTDEVTSPAPGRLVWQGRLLGEVHPHWGSALRAHQPDASTLARRDWKGVRAHLSWQHRGLELTAQRLRDTWLLFSTGATAGLTPVAVLMSNGVGRERLLRAAREPLEEPLASASCLRDF